MQANSDGQVLFVPGHGGHGSQAPLDGWVEGQKRKNDRMIQAAIQYSCISHCLTGLGGCCCRRNWPTGMKDYCKTAPALSWCIASARAWMQTINLASYVAKQQWLALNLHLHVNHHQPDSVELSGLTSVFSPWTSMRCSASGKQGGRERTRSAAVAEVSFCPSLVRG